MTPYELGYLAIAILTAIAIEIYMLVVVGPPKYVGEWVGEIIMFLLYLAIGVVWPVAFILAILAGIVAAVRGIWRALFEEGLE